jgi:GNAT superfamily N-acetyltransferase
VSLELTFQRYNGAGARAARDTVCLVHQDAYAEAIASGDPFDSVDEFMRRFESYTRPENTGFELVIGYTSDGEPVGQTWGWPLTPSTGWWTGLEGEPEPGFTREDGRRTFALSEIMVRKAWTGRGLAHALHDELLGTRPEQRATLLVEPDNERAERAYTSWGWRQVGRLRPGWENAPSFKVLMIDLPIAA